MKIMIDIGHPAHVHFYKNFIWEMGKRGHELIITARTKDVTFSLLNAHGFSYRRTGKAYKSIYGKVYEMLCRDYKLLTITRQFRPDICTAIGYLMSPIARKIARASFICFTDSEPTEVDRLFADHSADAICTPSCFTKDLGRKQVRYQGFHELAYLHPDYFRPDPSVLGELGLNENDKFVVVRFVSWQASHDIRRHGFDMRAKRELIKEIGEKARVFITSEGPLPDEFKQYRIAAPPEKMHSLLYYAALLVGDSQTMTTEAGILGTPAVRCNSFVGPGDMGNFIELEKKYDLIYSFSSAEKAIEKALSLLQQPDLKGQWLKKKERLFADKIDVTRFMVDFIENYPESFYRYRKEGDTDLL